MYNKINESFCDKKNDRDSLTLQIAGTESINEIKYKKRQKNYNNFKSSPIRMKTPEKKIKDIKKKAKARKYRQKKEVKTNIINNKIGERNFGQELNNYNNNNTATFNEENANKKYNEFTFHKDENINNNDFLENSNNENMNNYNDKYRNGGKIDLNENKEYDINYYNNKHLSIDVDNRKKILKLLKLKKVNINNNPNKNIFVKISKSQDQLRLPNKEISKTEKKYYHNNNFEKTFYNFANKGKLDKRLLKEIIYDKGSPRIQKKLKTRNIIDYEENSLINHSFDAPRTYQKKIIKRFENDKIKKKKNDFINQRVKSEDKLISPISHYNNRNNCINYSNTKTNEFSILKQSIGFNYITSNNSLTPMNKKWIYSSGNKNIISNYYNNNFYNTPIKNYVEQSSFYIDYNKRSRSLNNSIKKILDKSRKNRNYNQLNKRDNCVNISLNNSSANLNDDSFYFNNYNTNNSIFPKYEIIPIISYEYRTPKINLNKSKFQNHISINLEELIIIGEKLFDIIKNLVNNKKMANQCFEFWNYFFISTLQKEINIIILKSELKDAIYSVNYSLMSILICYDYSFDIKLIEKCFSLLKEILELIINNYFIFCKYIMKKVSKKNKDNKWIYKLNNMLSKNKNYSNINSINNNYIINNISSAEKIIFNTNALIKNLNIILEHFKSNSNESLLMLFKKISKKNYEDINYYFKNFLLREENINGSFLASLYLKGNPNFHTVPKPYITKPNNKKYTLILDLEETLLNFRLKAENKGEGILKIRPGLFEFLDEMQKLYEIILFTSSSQDYAESLIDSIEEKKKYFDYKFFRQHNIIIENDFVKDLSRIGRDLDKMIIVDNMPQNYRLNKKNGIHIKGFWGEDLCDRILYNLKDILINVAKDRGDLRDGLIKYHEDISDKITSNIYKFNFE